MDQGLRAGGAAFLCAAGTVAIGALVGLPGDPMTEIFAALGCSTAPAPAGAFAAERVPGTPSQTYPYGMSLRYLLAQGGPFELDGLSYRFLPHEGERTERTSRPGAVVEAAAGKDGVHYSDVAGSAQTLDVGDGFEVERVDPLRLELLKDGRVVASMLRGSLEVHYSEKAYPRDSVVPGPSLTVGNPNPTPLQLMDIDTDAGIWYLGATGPEPASRGSTISDVAAGWEPPTVAPHGSYSLGHGYGWLPGVHGSPSGPGTYVYALRLFHSFYDICGSSEFKLR